MANSKATGVAYSDPAVVGGSVDDSPVGATTPSTGAFTTLSSTGTTSLGNAAADLVGFHGSTADQAAYVASLSINALSVSGVIGFTTSASFSTAILAINSLIAMAVEKGLMAAS
jgi:hypothetical protein